MASLSESVYHLFRRCALLTCFSVGVRSAELFAWQIVSPEADPHSYSSAIGGTCAVVHDCPGIAETLDCSHMPSYECESYSEQGATIDTATDGTKTLYFQARLPPGSACGEQSCPACTKYRSCAGPFLQTTPMTMPSGSSVQWEWLATGKIDWYEVVVAVYSTDGELVSVSFQRGDATDWVQQELLVNASGTFFVRFHLGSYDETGGGMVGAEMKVRNFSFLYPTTFTTTTTSSNTTTTTTSSTTARTTTSATTTTTSSSRTTTSTTGSTSTPTTSMSTTTLTTPSASLVARVLASSPSCDESIPVAVFLVPAVVGFLAGLCVGFGIAWLFFFRSRNTSKVVPVKVAAPPIVIPPEPTDFSPVEPIFHPPGKFVEKAEEEVMDLPNPELNLEDVEEVLVDTIDPDHSLDIERVLIFLYPTLKSIFQFYCSTGTVGDVDLFRMTLKQFLLLLSDSGLEVASARAEIIFKQCVRDGRAAKNAGASLQFLRVSRSQNAELCGMAVRSMQNAVDRPNRAEEEKDLGYPEFVNALVYLAWDQLPKEARSRARDGGPRMVRAATGAALWTLVEDKVRPRAGRFDCCMPLRKTLNIPPVKGILAKAEDDLGILGQAFKAHVDNRTGRMPLCSFESWARQSGLLSNKHLSMPKLRECFVWAGDKDRGQAPEGWYPSESLNEGTVFTGPDYSRDEKLTRHEFAMACARIAQMTCSSSSDINPENSAAAITKFIRNLR